MEATGASDQDEFTRMPSASRGLEKYDPHVKIRNLGKAGSALEIDESVPLKRYFGSGNTMLRMAESYQKQGDLESAFILYTKYITRSLAAAVALWGVQKGPRLLSFGSADHVSPPGHFNVKATLLIEQHRGAVGARAGRGGLSPGACCSCSPFRREGGEASSEIAHGKLHGTPNDVTGSATRCDPEVWEMPSASRGLEKYDPHVKIRNLGKAGSALEIDESVPLKRYFGSGNTMLRMAESYQKQGDLESAFILYTKYITLFVEKISKHPEMSSASLTEWNITKKRVKEVFPIAEKLKSKLLEKLTKQKVGA
ncbi:putative amsh [Ixodes scapularis]